MKNLKKLGKSLSNVEQKKINGGFGNFISSQCYSRRDRCEIAANAYPGARCVRCTTSSGQQGWKAVLGGPSLSL